MADTKDTATRELTEPQKAWVAALRSGKYKQAMGALCAVDDDGQPMALCCLGVACELAIEAGVNLKTELVENSGRELRAYNDDEELPPYAVVSWLGLADQFGTLADHGRYDDDENTLAYRNDNGSSFGEIADLIEEHADTLFVEASS